MRIKPAVVAGLLVVLAVLVGGVQGTMARFTDEATVDAGASGATGTAFSSGSVATPVKPTTSQPSLSSLTINWTATAAGLGTAARYEVVRYASAGGGSGTVVCSTNGALSCVDTNPSGANAWYAVRARVGTSWVNEGARVAYEPDVTGPTLTITAPLNSCQAQTVACGTASDPSGIVKVEYSFRRTLNLFGFFQNEHYCWTGSAWDESNTATCPFRTADGTTSWTVPGVKDTAYRSTPLYARTFVLTVRVTDGFGNVTTQTS